MTPERIVEIRERLAAASPGPWRYDSADDSSQWGEVLIADATSIRECIADLSQSDFSADTDNANGAFIANARQDVPDLLAALVDAQKRLAAAEAELAQLRTIFSRDLLEDDAGVRAAYERGLNDGRDWRKDHLQEWLNSSGQVALLHAIKTYKSPTQEGQE